MGFRSTFITESNGVRWPAWFTEKYRDRVHFRYADATGAAEGEIASQYEAKVYGPHGWEDLAEDIQRAIDWDDPVNPQASDSNPFILVYLHECGGLTRAEIRRGSVRYSVPTEWEEVDGDCHDLILGHLYCYGCSDLDRPKRARYPIGGNRATDPAATDDLIAWARGQLQRHDVPADDLTDARVAELLKEAVGEAWATVAARGRAMTEAGRS